MYLTVADYAVTVVMLMIPLAIGIFYAWKDSKNGNREEYLLGGRKMNVLPVALSMIVTFQSAISLIGFPSDVYKFGIMVTVLYVAASIGSFVGCYLMVPLMHPLQLTSIFDYLELRYKSHAVRMFSTVVGMLQTFFYMVIAMVAPGLALQAAAGIPFWMSVLVVGSIGTLYTAIGGIKSVIWTDVFQAIIIVFGLLLLIVRGTMEIGGPGTVWSVAEEGGRLAMDSFSFDPRVRHTWWGLIIGGTFMWQTYIYTQSTFQRVCSVNTVAKARKVIFLNIPYLFIYGALVAAVGILIYAYFFVTRCDPLESGAVSNMNQISLYFMLLLLQDIPGLAGLYMATIFSGALSTLSSGLNALAANTTEDILAGWLRGVSERKATVFTKIIVFVYGISIMAVAYLARALQGPVTQMSVSISGSFGSVVAGMFITGALVPWANKYGVFAGGAVSSVLNLWILIGNIFHGTPTPPLSPVPTDRCESVFDVNSFSSGNSTAEPPVALASSASDAHNPYDYGFFLYDISYVWYPMIGILTCSFTILIVSRLTRRYDETKTDPKLILPSLRNYWQLDEIQEKETKDMECLCKPIVKAMDTDAYA